MSIAKAAVAASDLNLRPTDRKLTCGYSTGLPKLEELENGANICVPRTPQLQESNSVADFTDERNVAKLWLARR